MTWVSAAEREPTSGIQSPKSPRTRPPEGRHVIEAKLSEWELFVNSGVGLDPLVRMALAHYQFEAIHPFADGNGRTGRILNVLMLVTAGLITTPILYLSRYIIRTKDEYYRALRAVSADDAWIPWVKYMLEGVRQTAKSTLAKIQRANDLQQQMKETLRSLPSGTKVHLSLLDVLFEQPYCRITNVIEACAVTRPTATKWLKELESIGELTSIQRGREKLFINRKFLDSLLSDEGLDEDPSGPAPLF